MLPCKILVQGAGVMQHYQIGVDRVHVGPTKAMRNAQAHTNRLQVHVAGLLALDLFCRLACRASTFLGVLWHNMTHCRCSCRILRSQGLFHGSQGDWHCCGLVRVAAS